MGVVAGGYGYGGHYGKRSTEAGPDGYSTGPVCQEHVERQCHKVPQAHERKVPRQVCHLAQGAVSPHRPQGGQEGLRPCLRQKEQPRPRPPLSLYTSCTSHNEHQFVQISVIPNKECTKE